MSEEEFNVNRKPVEFNLSEHEEIIFNKKNRWYHKKYVKEFIRMVGELSYVNNDGKRVVNLSDIKLKAGEKLNG